jgi:hypothetical protein
MHTPKVSTKRVLGLALATAMAVTGTVTFASSSEAAAGKVVASPTSGPENVAGKVVTLTGTGFKTGSTIKVGTAATSGIQFNLATTCPLTSATAGTGIVDVSARTVVTATKLVVTVPALDVSLTGATQKWSVCVYDTATPNVLLSAGTYSTLPAPTIAGANSPASGSVAGGDIVTVSGTGFTKTTKVKFGTVASTKVVVASDGLSLTAVAPAAPAGAVAISVTTDGGTNATPLVGGDDDYTYQNAIVVSPAFGDGVAGNSIDISGVGFSAVTSPEVVFTRAGMQSATDDAATCTDVQVVSDTEIVCGTTPALLTTLSGAWIVVVTSDSSKFMADGVGVKPTFETVLSSGAAYTSAPF